MSPGLLVESPSSVAVAVAVALEGEALSLFAIVSHVTLAAAVGVLAVVPAAVDVLLGAGLPAAAGGVT